MITKTPSLEQFTHAKVAKHPILFASTEYEISKFAVLNQLLNVIGNGIRDEEEFMEEVLSIEVVDATRFFNEGTTTGYYSVNDFGSGYLHPNIDGKRVECFVSEKDQYPDVKKWTDWEVMKTFPMPYSNFTKEYSIVWRCGVFSKLDQDWRDGAIWFYQKAKNIIFFREHEYHGSFPKKTRQENEKIIKSQLVAFGTRTYEEISRDWGHPYDGDIVKFLTTKWEKERNSIFSFIDETIHMLQQLS